MSAACKHFVLLNIFGTASIPVPDTSVRLGANSLLVPDNSVSSVRALKYLPGTGIPSHQNTGGTGIYLARARHPTEHSGMVPYELDTSTRHFNKFRTDSIPVLYTSVNSVFFRYRYPTIG